MDTAIDESKRLTAYNVKTKQKNVPMYNVAIMAKKTGNRTAYIAQGTDKEGKYKLVLMLSLAKADEAINAGVAARGVGWPEI